MSFQQALNTHFPQAMPEAEFVRRAADLLARQGFTPDNSLACAALCRDEMTRSLAARIEAVWGRAFDFSGLGGMLFLGQTGFRAAHSHAPVTAGRERYVYFALPHVAIGAAGEPGVCRRPGRRDVSGACGALMAFRQEMLAGRLNLTLDRDDVEQGLLKQRLLPKIEYGVVPGLITLTRLAHEAILEDLQRLAGLTVDTATADYAIITGIQIHGPEGEQYVWPGAEYAVRRGRRYSL